MIVNEIMNGIIKLNLSLIKIHFKIQNKGENIWLKNLKTNGITS